MTIEEILAGESKNVEFKENLPDGTANHFLFRFIQYLWF